MISIWNTFLRIVYVQVSTDRIFYYLTHGNYLIDFCFQWNNTFMHEIYHPPVWRAVNLKWFQFEILFFVYIQVSTDRIFYYLTHGNHLIDSCFQWNNTFMYEIYHPLVWRATKATCCLGKGRSRPRMSARKAISRRWRNAISQQEGRASSRTKEGGRSGGRRRERRR